MDAYVVRSKRKREGEEVRKGGGEGEAAEEQKQKEKVSPTRTPRMTETFTITFGDQAENHAGMQKLGEKATEGFSLEDLQKAKAWFEERGVKVELHHLNEALPSPGDEEEGPVKKLKEENGEKKDKQKKPRSATPPAQDAYVLVARGGLEAIVDDVNAFHAEQAALQKDTRALMYGRVVEKRARHNLCFADHSQSADYANGKGTVVAFDDLPLLKRVRGALPEILGPKAADLLAEGNYYFDITKCGIGFHGDAERCKVVAVRTGAAIPLHYQWFLDCKPVGERVKLILEHGDVYVMSEKAVGTDFKCRRFYTLRHAAGAKKFLTIK
ncbi:putative Mimivirus encoded protein [Balamuthia mandrillaris]